MAGVLSLGRQEAAVLLIMRTVHRAERGQLTVPIRLLRRWDSVYAPEIRLLISWSGVDFPITRTKDERCFSGQWLRMGIRDGRKGRRSQLAHVMPLVRCSRRHQAPLPPRMRANGSGKRTIAHFSGASFAAADAADFQLSHAIILSLLPVRETTSNR